MAVDIPNVGSNIDTLMKGVDTGSNLIHKMMLNKYNNTIHPSGDVANAMYVEQLRNQFGENDPRYLEAKHAHDLGLMGRQSLMDYRNVLNQTAGMRSTSPLGKQIAEGKGQGAQDIINNFRKGAVPNSGYSYDQSGNNVIASPSEVNDAVMNSLPRDNNPRSAEEREAYERAINKTTSDAAARNKLNFATNLDLTRKSINPDDLTRYSGLKGTGNYLRESAKATLGNPSDEYIANQKALAASSLMVDQMRQFYGDSIQPAAMQRLTKLANTSTWIKDPKVAKAQWDQLNTILDKETQTYREKGTSPIHLNGLDFKNGKFVSGNDKETPPPNQEQNINSISKKRLKFNPDTGRLE